MDRYDLEAGMLTIMFMDENLEFVQLNKLSKELFELSTNQVIFEKLVDIREKNKPYDMMLLYQGYGFTQVEAQQIETYINTVSGVHNFGYYYNALVRSYYERQSREMSAGKITFEEYNASINRFSNINKDVKLFNTKNDMVQFTKELEKYVKGEFNIYKLGIKELDDKLGDVIDGTMAVVAGKTSTGKTWMLLQAAYNLASQGLPVLYLSCEMGKFKLIKRIIQNLTGINVKAGIFKDMTEEAISENDEMKRIMKSVEKINEVDLTIAEMSSFDEKVINDLIKSTKAKVVLLDFIQQFNLNEKAETRAAAVSDIANGIKRMATRHELLVLVGSQLNKTSPVWDLAALKESGGIGEATDIAIMLERLDDTFDEEKRKVGYKIHISKNRDGETGTIEMAFSYLVCKFISKMEA